MHGFYVDKKKNIVSFDLIFSFDEKKAELITDEIKEKLKEKYNEYKYNIIIDRDY